MLRGWRVETRGVQGEIQRQKNVSLGKITGGEAPSGEMYQSGLGTQRARIKIGQGNERRGFPRRREK